MARCWNKHTWTNHIIIFILTQMQIATCPITQMQISFFQRGLENYWATIESTHWHKPCERIQINGRRYIYDLAREEIYGSTSKIFNFSNWVKDMLLLAGIKPTRGNLCENLRMLRDFIVSNSAFDCDENSNETQIMAAASHVRLYPQHKYTYISCARR